jgi:hypothetical protein
VLAEQRLKTGKGDAIMTIAKYEEAIVDQSRRIIESDEILKPFLEEIEDLNNQLQQEDDDNEEQQNRTREGVS